MSEVSLEDVAEYQQRIKKLESQLLREKQKNHELRNKERRYEDRLVEAVAEAAEGLQAPAPRPPVDRRPNKDAEKAIIMWSDWQLGKKTSTYSSDVCHERINLFTERADRILEVQRADHPVKEAHVFLLGDMIEGELIFPGQEWELDADLFDQIAERGPNVLIDGLDWAANRFKQVYVHAVPGNHGYLGGRQRRNMSKKANGDRILYRVTERIMKAEGYKNISWDVSMDWHLVADLGEKLRFLLLHGDQVRGYNGIPWYGWTRKVLAWDSMRRIWGEDWSFDHVAGGHFHTPVSIYLNGMRLWINASTESHNPYALEQLAAAGEPAQWLLFGKPGRGITAEYLVDLQ